MSETSASRIFMLFIAVWLITVLWQNHYMRKDINALSGVVFEMAKSQALINDRHLKDACDGK